MTADLFATLNLTGTNGDGFTPAGLTDGRPSGASVAGDDETGYDNGPPAGGAGGPVCDVCGRDIPLTPTGRVPRVKLCQDHKSRTSSTAGEGRTPRNQAATGAKKARLDAIVGDLQQGIGEFAGTISAVAPVTAGTMLLTGPDAMEALVRIASDYPRMLDGLEKAAKAVPYVSVAKFVAAIMLAIMVDMDRMAPVGMAAEYLRVAEAAEKVHWRPRTEVPEGMPTAGPPTQRVAPPRFKL